MTTTDLRYRVSKSMGLYCPVCGCAIEDANVHTAWHQSLATMVSEAAARKARR